MTAELDRLVRAGLCAQRARRRSGRCLADVPAAAESCRARAGPGLPYGQDRFAAPGLNRSGHTTNTVDGVQVVSPIQPSTCTTRFGHVTTRKVDCGMSKR